MPTRAATPYRLPWVASDAPTVWLKVTARCDISCHGCPPAAGPRCDVPVDTLRERLDDALTWTAPTTVGLVGGEPLLHDHLAEIVWMVRRTFGLRPLLATNGLALEEDRLRALVDAGLAAVALQVDATQRRRGGVPSTAGQRRAERQRLVSLLAGSPVAVSLHTLVDDDAVDEAVEVAAWAAAHAGLIRELVFRVRDPRPAGDPRPSPGARLLRALTHADPEYATGAWRAGNAEPGDDALHIATRVLSRGRVLGYLGGHAAELLHTTHHLLAGRWPPTATAAASPGLLGALGLVDRGARTTLGRWLGDTVFDRRHHVHAVHLQTVVIAEAVAGDVAGVCQGHPAFPAFA